MNCSSDLHPVTVFLSLGTNTVFTGIIQGLGQLRPLQQNRLEIVVSSSIVDNLLSDLAIGDSVAVDGVCLTAEAIATQGFIADVSPETLSRSTLGRASQKASYVNLETSLRVGGKIGGHFVTGHVDGIGALRQAIATDNAWELTFAAPLGLEAQWQTYLTRYLVSKGSISINGISLTIANCDLQGNWFTVAVIPHTYGETNLQYLQAGDWVNLEGDILGKYVERLLGYHGSPNLEPEIGLDFLAEHGYS